MPPPFLKLHGHIHVGPVSLVGNPSLWALPACCIDAAYCISLNKSGTKLSMLDKASSYVYTWLVGGGVLLGGSLCAVPYLPVLGGVSCCEGDSGILEMEALFSRPVVRFVALSLAKGARAYQSCYFL